MIKFLRKQTHYSFVFFLVISLFPLLCVLAQADVSFRDVTTEMGIDFKHFNDFSPAHRLVETMGSGGVLFDFDRDVVSLSVNRWAHGYTTGGPGRSTRIGRQPFGRIVIANADSAPGADAKTAMMMAHRAVGELA